MKRFWILLALLLAAAPAWAQEAAWRRIHDPTLGVSMEVRGQTIIEGIMERDGTMIAELSENTDTSNPMGLAVVTLRISAGDFDLDDLAQMQHLNLAHMKPGERRSRDGRIGGMPARIHDYSLGEGDGRIALTAAYVKYSGRIYSFVYIREMRASAQADRFFGSIRFDRPSDNVSVTSRILLLNAIQEYWTMRGTAEAARFNPDLAAIAAPKRDGESRQIRGFGAPIAIGQARFSQGRRTFRVNHEHANVDWTIADDGKTISALSWQVISRK